MARGLSAVTVLQESDCLMEDLDFSVTTDSYIPETWPVAQHEVVAGKIQWLFPTSWESQIHGEMAGYPATGRV